jgi:DNA-binding NtrC family response regulator
LKPHEPGQNEDEMNRELEDLIARMRASGFRYEETIAMVQRAYIKHTLLAVGGNQCAAAEEFGMHRNTFHRLFKEVRLGTWHGDRRYRPRRKPLATAVETDAGAGPADQPGGTEATGS